jgi:hypothetical protein
MRATILLVIVLLAPAMGEAQINIRPGQYEVTLEMNMPIPADAQKAVLDAAGFNKQKRLECFTADDVKDMKNIAQYFTRETEGLGCKIADLKTTGNKLTFNMTCEEDELRMTSTTEMTFGTDSMTSFTRAKYDELGESTVKTSAKRVGACTK